MGEMNLTMTILVQRINGCPNLPFLYLYIVVNLDRFSSFSRIRPPCILT